MNLIQRLYYTDDRRVEMSQRTCEAFTRFSTAGCHSYPLLEGWGGKKQRYRSQGMGHPEDPGNVVNLSPGSWNQGQYPATTRRVARKGREKFFMASFLPPLVFPPGLGHQEQNHLCDTQWSKGMIRCDIGTCRPYCTENTWVFIFTSVTFSFDNS